MKGKTVIQRIASLVVAIKNCQKSGNTEWLDKHSEELETIVDSYLPSGSGFDSGMSINLIKSTHNRIVFNTSFHHMDENGFYDGWTDHVVYVTPSFDGMCNIQVTGRNKNDIKDYIAETFSYEINRVIE